MVNAFLTSDQQWRMKTELNEISPLLRKTIIAKEDKYFYSHPGVNPFAVTRAFFKNLFRMKRTSGASTITMQVARAWNRGNGISSARSSKCSGLFNWNGNTVKMKSCRCTLTLFLMAEILKG